MKTTNAIKKLVKNGFEIKKNENMISGCKGDYRINFYDQDSGIVCIHSDNSYARENRDSMTDYFPETHHSNITKAILFVDSCIKLEGAK